MLWAIFVVLGGKSFFFFTFLGQHAFCLGFRSALGFAVKDFDVFRALFKPSVRAHCHDGRRAARVHCGRVGPHPTEHDRSVRADLQAQARGVSRRPRETLPPSKRRYALGQIAQSTPSWPCNQRVLLNPACIKIVFKKVQG